MLKIHPRDNVAVAITHDEAVPFGHKAALTEIKAGAEVIKYGHAIGRAARDIRVGEHVHLDNLASTLSGHLSYDYKKKSAALAPRPPSQFMGFRRADGRVGIRNEIWIIPTVGCVNAVGVAIARAAADMLKGSVTALHSFSHPHGCSQLGSDHENTQKILAGLARHPNAGGVLLLGLGCENNGIDAMKQLLGEVDTKRTKFLVCQDVEDEMAAALALVEELIDEAAGDKREALPTSELTVGLKCGGSDGLSGITANPLLGAFCDRLCAEGGSAILTEVPEMFGAETILMERCRDEAVFRKCAALINDFKAYLMSHGQPIHENPSPGNREGGLTTLEEKALGCIQKGGSAEVADVLAYGEIRHTKGLNLLESPGNDLVSATALAAAGAQLVLFSTGRGTPFGCPVPTLKIASNTEIFDKKRHWLDFDAGPLTAGVELSEMADDFYTYVMDVTSGRKLCHTERQGLRDIAIFKDGVTM